MPALIVLPCTLILLAFLASDATAQWFLFNRAQRRYQGCVELYDAKEFKDTRICINEFLSDYPNSRWVEHLQFIDAKLETDVYEAQAKMHRFLQEFPEGPYSAEANYSLGQLLELTADYDRAQKFLWRVYDYFSTSELRDASAVEAAKCMLLSGDAESARARLKAYLATSPKQPWRSRANELYADALFDTGEFMLAQQKYKEIISETSSPGDVSPECYIKIAAIYEGAGDYEAALQAYRRFISIFPNAIQRPAVERKIADLASSLGIDLSADRRPHIVEAGLFNSRQEAIRLVARLKRLGYHAYLVSRDVDHSEVLSVRLGPYDSRNSALAVAERLREEADLDVTLLPQGGMF